MISIKATEQIPKPLHKSIDAQNIDILVREFYAKVLEHPTLCVFFIQKLGKDIQNEKWEEHLLLLIEFWKFVALDYEEYNGNPLKPHFDIENIDLDAFKNWLELFHLTVDNLYTPSAGRFFKEKSQDIAENFIRRLNLKK